MRREGPAVLATGRQAPGPRLTKAARKGQLNRRLVSRSSVVKLNNEAADPMWVMAN